MSKRDEYLAGARAGIPVLLGWKKAPVMVSVLCAIFAVFVLYLVI